MKRQAKNEAISAFDALMEAAVDAIVIIDRDGLIRRFNSAAQDMFGYSEPEVRGHNVRMLMPEPQSANHDRYIARYLETGKARVIGKGREDSGLRRNGQVFPMALSVGEIRLEQGGGFVAIIRDLSERRIFEEQVRQLEEQLVHADRLVILGELTAGIAHEINQPLTAIAAYSDAGKSLVSRSTQVPSHDLEIICERIGEQSRRAAEVVQRLRKLVRTGTVSKAWHDINNIIRNTLLLFEYEVRKMNTVLEFYPNKKIQNLYLDEIQIQQILVNLVKNSLDAINSAGRQDGRIEIRVKLRRNEVDISVRDNGTGIPVKNRRRLFESFFTTKPKGVGLGLSICKNIAAAHGGNLRFTQPPEGGSLFTLSLPLAHIG